jgi:hypothetical protein
VAVGAKGGVGGTGQAVNQDRRDAMANYRLGGNVFMDCLIDQQDGSRPGLSLCRRAGGHAARAPRRGPTACADLR